MFIELTGKLNTDKITDFHPGPPALDRGSWAALPLELISRLIDNGEKYLAFAYPPLPASLYMDFSKTGNRSNFETSYFKRRRALSHLTMAECAEGKGRFIQDIIDGIYAICEESGWQLPAHNSYIRDSKQLILPVSDQPVLELFSCETGALLAMVHFLLKDTLDSISPEIDDRILRELRTRMVEPYLNNHFWWMGNGDEPMCNWTPWCTQNVLLTVFSTGQSAAVKEKVLHQAAYSLDCFLKDYGEDGCCDEGAQYYRHGSLCLFNALEVMNEVTDGLYTELYRSSKIRNMAAYIRNVHVGDIYYVNFADCSPVAGRAGAREFLFGKRVENEMLTAFAAQDWKKSGVSCPPDEINLFYHLQAAYAWKELENTPAIGNATDTVTGNAIGAVTGAVTETSTGDLTGELAHPDIYYESAGVFIARDDVYCLAAKAGDNNDSHNHNDTGSITVYKNGQPLLIDIGVETYTRRTFSPQRYEIWTMQSAWHNLPTFEGIMQSPGEEFCARDVNVDFSEEAASISMELTNAYPTESGLESYRRTVVLNKGQNIVLTDEYVGSRSATASLIFSSRPEIISCSEIILDGLASISWTTQETEDLGMTCSAVSFEHVHATVEAVPATVEAVPAIVEAVAVTDPRLRLAWPDTIYRVLIPFNGKLKLTIV